jgi:hypothetical protein
MARSLVLLSLLLLASCVDYTLEPDPDDPPKGDTQGEPGETEPPVDSDPPEDDEECNGEDDDGDGLIDEGYDDTDGDGIADCLDDGCDVTTRAAGTVAVLEECQAYDPDEVADPWDLNLEWQYTASGATVVMPATGNLTDDNGDGVIDSNDVPDVAFTSYNGGTLHIVSGDTGRAVCTASGFRGDGGVIIADVDGDGKNEVVGPTNSGQVRAVDGTCATKWTSSRSYSMMYPVTTAADLDGDGDVEVIADVAVVNGADGSHVAQLSPQNSSCWRSPVVADIDLDGQQEILLGNSVFSPTGSIEWSASGSGTSCFAAVADLDGDPEAEVILSFGNSVTIYQHDGARGASASLAVSNPGPPCVGDIDGDGLAEFIAPNGTRISAFENDGTAKWSAGMSDGSGAAGCSVFDMNGDEVYEVLFADEQALRLYDGVTGGVLYQNTSHGSVTYFEIPTIADVDNDGSAEMLVANSSGSYTGITTFGHAGSGWPESGPTWGLHDFAATNQNSDGSIPSSPTPSWQSYNVFRGRPYDDIPGTPDLVVSIDDVCVSSCDPEVGVVEIAYQVSNQGGSATSVECWVSLWVTDGGVPTMYDRERVSAADSGTAAAGGTFVVPLADMGSRGFVLRVDDDGTGVGVIDECIETNNEAEYSESFCG